MITFVDLFNETNNYISKILEHFIIPPSFYHDLLPDNKKITLTVLNQLIQDGIFKTMPSLAPAFTYCILLSIIRYVLHWLIFKVRNYIYLDILIKIYNTFTIFLLIAYCRICNADL